MAQEEDTEDPAQEAANSTSFCPHCGGPTDKGGRTAVPPYQLSKFSPQDRGFGALGQSALHAAGRMAAAANTYAKGE